MTDVLLSLRDVGIRHLPEDGDVGDRRVRAAIEHELAADGSRSRARWWTTRRVRIGRFSVAPIVALLAVFTVSAVTAGAVVTVNATTVFQDDPQAQLMPNGKDFNGDIETVLPSTVRQLTTVTVPDYGQVAVWGATTKPGGFCFAMKLPDGDWGGLPLSSNAIPAANGWDGGSIPGCFQTRQQQILKQTPLKPGQQPSGKTGQELMPLPVEQWDNEVKNSDGRVYEIYVGYVEVQGTAATVRDPATGVSTQVLPSGYYVLAEPEPAGGVDGGAELQVLDASGQQLKPDYTWGGMLGGHSPGPSQSAN